MSTQYTISNLANEFDITTRTLRFYEEKGLLNPTRNGQARIYSAADRTRLKLVLRGKRIGLSLEDSAEIIGMYDPCGSNQQQLEKLLSAIAAQKAKLLAQQNALNDMMKDLDQVEKRTRSALKSVRKKAS